MTLFAQNVGTNVTPTTPMKLISPSTVLVTTIVIAIVKIVIKILSNTTNLSTKLLKNGVDGNAFVAQ